MFLPMASSGCLMNIEKCIFCPELLSRILSVEGLFSPTSVSASTAV
jgi:hypothetical protein